MTDGFWMSSLWIGLGGGLGSMGRFLASNWIARHAGETFPWGTIAVNVTGSFVIGLFAALTSPDGRWLVAPVGRQFFMIGVLGGYTTFSSFSLQTLNLARDGDWLRASGNVLFSVVGCLVAVWLGHWAGSQFNSMKGA